MDIKKSKQTYIKFLHLAQGVQSCPSSVTVGDVSGNTGFGKCLDIPFIHRSDRTESLCKGQFCSFWGPG